MSDGNETRCLTIGCEQILVARKSGLTYFLPGVGIKMLRWKHGPILALLCSRCKRWRAWTAPTSSADERERVAAYVASRNGSHLEKQS